MSASIDAMRDLSLRAPDIWHFGVADWLGFYRKELTSKQFEAVRVLPWDDGMPRSPCPFYEGKQIRDTHFLFAGFDTMNTIDLQCLNLPKTEEGANQMLGRVVWCFKEKFAKEMLKPRWYLLLRDVVPGSKNKSFDAQKGLLPPEYEVPSVCEEVAKDFLLWKKTDAVANKDCYARTRDMTATNGRAGVGLCRPSGVYVLSFPDEGPLPSVGIGASRRLGI